MRTDPEVVVTDLKILCSSANVRLLDSDQHLMPWCRASQKVIGWVKASKTESLEALCRHPDSELLESGPGQQPLLCAESQWVKACSRPPAMNVCKKHSRIFYFSVDATQQVWGAKRACRVSGSTVTVSSGATFERWAFRDCLGTKRIHCLRKIHDLSSSRHLPFV